MTIALIDPIPAPRVCGGKVLYLDFDGVLHPENVHMTGRGPRIVSPDGHRLLEHAGLLEELLSPYPSVAIVLSTSWVRVYRGVYKVARRLPQGLRQRVIGATWHSAMDAELFRAAPRGMQIWADVARRQPEAWLALDDDWLHWPTWCRDQLVRTDEILGIAEPPVLARLREKLALLA
jgi:hypothetical protein